MKKNSLFTDIVFALFAVCVIFGSLAIPCAIAYAIVHFVGKYW